MLDKKVLLSKRNLCLILVFVMVLSMTAMMFSAPALAKTDVSDPAPSLIVNLLNPDGSVTLVHEYQGTPAAYNDDGSVKYYTYPELEAIATDNYYATIDAMPASVGTKAHGVTVSALINDAKKYNSDISWKSGMKLVMYPTDASTYPYQGANYYTYDFLEGQDRYYYPNLVQAYANYKTSQDSTDLAHAFDDPVPVEPMFCTSSFQERWATDDVLKANTEGSIDVYSGSNLFATFTTPVTLSAIESFRFCMGLTPAEAQQGVDGTFSSTNKFCRWAYRVDVGPVNGQALTADSTNAIVGQPITITFTDKEDWRDDIDGIQVDGTTVDPTHYAIAAGEIDFDNTVFATSGSHTVKVMTSNYMWSSVTQTIGVPPTLRADTSNNLFGQNIDIAFTDSQSWRDAVTGVKVGETVITDYTLTSGNLAIPAADFLAAGDYTVTVSATNYNDATVTQTILKSSPILAAGGPRAPNTEYSLIFTDDENWRNAITDIKSGQYGSSYSGHYTITPGHITFDNTLFTDLNAKSVYITATGYPAVSVTLPKVLTADTTDNKVGQPIQVTYNASDSTWRNAITDVTVNGNSIAGQYDKSVTKVITINAGVFSAPGNYTIAVKAANSVYVDAIVVQTIGGTTLTPPTLTADTTDNTVGHAVAITFTDNATWRTAVTGVTVNGTAVSGYSFDAAGGILTIPAGTFTTAGDYTIAVQASGYSDATVTQTMNAAVSYTVTFMSDGSAYTTVTAEEGSQIAAPTNPTKLCYTFAGWYTNEALSTAAAFPYTVTGNASLFAKWTRDTYGTLSTSPATDFKIYLVDKAGNNVLVDSFAYDAAGKNFIDSNGNPASFVKDLNLVYSGKDAAYTRLAVGVKGILFTDLNNYFTEKTGITVTNNVCLGTVASDGFVNNYFMGPTPSGYTYAYGNMGANRYYYPSYLINGTLDDTTKVPAPAALILKGWNDRTSKFSPAITNEATLQQAIDTELGEADEANAFRVMAGQLPDNSELNLGNMSSKWVSYIKYSPIYFDIATNISGGDATITTDDGYLKACDGEPVSFTVNTGSGISSVTVTCGDGSTTIPVSENNGTYSFTMPGQAVTINVTLAAAGPSVWDGSIDTSWYNTTDTSFTLNTPAQLAGLAAIVNGTATGIAQDSFSDKKISLGGNIVLDEDNQYTTNDLYFQDGDPGFSGTFTVPTLKAGANVWMPIGNSNTVFAGTFDGCGYTVSGLYTDVTASYQGLFGYLGQGAVVKNIKVSGAVLGLQFAGGIAGGANGATIDHAINNALIYVSGGAPGGSGTNSGTGISGAGKAGGILGIGTGSITNPVNISNCVNNGTVTCPNCYKGGRVGGIVGIFDLSGDYASITKCYNTAAIKGYQYVGGIVGGQFGYSVSVSECYNSGTVSGCSSGKVYAGGIIGKSQGPVANCYNTGNIVSTATTGSIPTRFAGIAGETANSTATITNCYNIGQIVYPASNPPSTSGNIVGSQASNPVNCFYLDSTSYANAGDKGTTTAKTEAEMKDAGMPGLLGSAFGFDSNNYNNGYPVLAWQNGEVVTPVAHSISLSYDNSLATVISSVNEAVAGTEVTVSVTGLASGKKVQSVTVSDDYSNSYTVTQLTENSSYSFTMGDDPVTVTVLFEDDIVTGDPYNFTVNANLDPIWTVNVESSGRSGAQINAGATVTVTVNRMDEAYATSLNGIVVKDQNGNPVDVSTASTNSGGYNTVKSGVFTFTMPESAITIDLNITYAGLSVYVQDGESGTPTLVKTYSRDDMIALDKTGSIYYTAYDKYPTAVIGKATQVVTLSDLFADAGLSYATGDSIKLSAIDGYNKTIPYNDLYGATRYYYPNIAASENQDEGKTPIDTMLVIQGYQSRFMDLSAGQTIDDMNCDTLNAYRFIFGQTEAQFNSGVPDINNATAGSFVKYVTSIVVINNNHTVTVDSNITGGTVTADKTSAAAGDTVTLTVTPDSGKQLESGSLVASYNNGSETQTLNLTAGENHTYTFTMPAYNVAVTAEFEDMPVTYAINVNSITGGTVTSNVANAVAGATVTLTVVPGAGKQLQAGSLTVSYNNGLTAALTAGENNTYTFTMPAYDVNVSASFLPYYSMAAESDDAYSATIDSSRSVVMTVNNNVSGMKYFKVDINALGSNHVGKETVIFVHYRNGVQMSINATVADFDTVNTAQAGFNVQAGDVVKVYIVDTLTNSKLINPIALQ